MVDVVVREAEAAEYQRVARLLGGSEALRAAPSPEELGELDRVLVAECNGEIVGCVAVKRLDFYLSTIKYMYVRKEHRERGIGSKLAEKAFRSIATPFVIITVSKRTPKSIEFWKKRGFREIGEYESEYFRFKVMLRRLR